MNWINNVVRPKIQDILSKREMPDNLWIKCPESGQMVFHKDLEANQFVIPGSGYHMRMDALTRLNSIFDDQQYTPIEVGEVAADPLKFRDERKYVDRLKDNRAKTKMSDAVLSGVGKICGMEVVASVQDFSFMGGSLGMGAGEAIITAMLKAVELEAPFIMFAASGGARMQEGILSLMQMPRTTIAVQKLREAKLPYIVVFTNPTTGGVTASYAMLGDIHIAEPGALICFAGPRVIKQTIREQLPEGFQRSEFLLDHGMVDMVVHRHDLRHTLSKLCHVLMQEPVPQQLTERPSQSDNEQIEQAGATTKQQDLSSPAANTQTLPNGAEQSEISRDPNSARNEDEATVSSEDHSNTNDQSAIEQKAETNGNIQEKENGHLTSDGSADGSDTDPEPVTASLNSETETDGKRPDRLS